MIKQLTSGYMPIDVGILRVDVGDFFNYFNKIKKHKRKFMALCLPQTVRLDSRKIKQIREEKGLTQLYVATVVGVTIDTISRWENRRYPSVKRENALKLAQTLEVEVEEILEEPSVPDESVSNREQTKPSGEKDEQQSAGQGKDAQKKPIRNVMVTVAAAVVFGTIGLLVGYIIFRPSDAPLDISAVRFLPKHCAQGSLFPVVVTVNISPQDRRTILLKEDIPRTLRVIKSVPRYTSHGKGLLKWLYQGDTKRLKFVYIAKMPLSLKENKKLRFRGTVTIKTSQTVNVTVGGRDVIRAAPFHWADRNGDNLIDDEEILDAYQLLSGIKGMASMLKEVENLWAAGKYQWDKGSKRFLPIKDNS